MTKKSLKKKNKPVTKFTIDRAKWLNGELIKRYDDVGRGDDAPMSTLLHEGGTMCCLGFYAKECGVPRKVLAAACEPGAIISPKQTAKFSPKIVKWDEFNDRAHNTAITSNLIDANDNEMPIAKREKKIISLFKKAGITCKIIGKYPVIK